MSRTPPYQACANGLSAYTIVGHHGSGVVSYNLALTAVFIEGFVFVGLSLIGMRQWLVKVIPVSLKIAAACGIGLFISEIGLSYSAGIGAITGAINTPLEIAGCPEIYRDENGFCKSHKMTNPTVSLSSVISFRTDLRFALLRHDPADHGRCRCGLVYFVVVLSQHT